MTELKFVAACKALADAVTTASTIVERRNTYPILANIVLSAADDVLTLRATDLDIEITLQIEAKVASPGVTTVPAAMLRDILRKMPKDAEISISQDERAGTVLVSSGRSRFHIATLSPESFPDLKSGAFTTSFEIGGKAFAGALGKVQFAISTEETRYYLNGVYMHAVDGTGDVRFVATDGHRMARCTMEVVGAIGMPGIIIPKKTVAEIIKIGDAAGEAVLSVDISDSKIRVGVGTTTLVSKLIEGQFPDYERVTPKGNNKVATVDSIQMQGCVDRVSTIATERGGKAVKLEFKDGLVALEVSNPDHGTANDEMPVDLDADTEVAIAFNARYLGDVLGNLGKGTVRIEMMDESSPAVFSGEGDAGLLCVLMPMRA